MTEHPTPADPPAVESAQQDAPEAPPPLPLSVPEVAAPEHTLAQGTTPELSSTQEAPSLPAAPSTARMRGRRTLPASPVERAKLEAQEGTLRNEESDRTTMVAFGLLFIVPLLIILLSLLLFLPFIHSQLSEEPSGAQVQTSANGLSPTR